MKQITENIFAVEVEQHDSEFKISGTNYLCSKVDGQWQPLPPRLGETGFEKFEILGTWQNGSADFDVYPYVQKFKSWSGTKDIIVFKDYLNKWDKCLFVGDSFNSLLISKGIKDKKYVLLIKN